MFRHFLPLQRLRSWISGTLLHYSAQSTLLRYSARNAKLLSTLPVPTPAAPRHETLFHPRIIPPNEAQRVKAGEVFEKLMSAVADLESPTIRVANVNYSSVALVKQTCDAALAPICLQWQFFIFHGSDGPSSRSRNARAPDWVLFNRGVSKLSKLDLSRLQPRCQVLTEIDRFASFLAARLLIPRKYTFTW